MSIQRDLNGLRIYNATPEEKRNALRLWQLKRHNDITKHTRRIIEEIRKQNNARIGF
jgi:hypothetical protein